MRKGLVYFLSVKFLKMLFTVWFVSSLIFFLIRLMPSGPVERYIENQMIQYAVPLAEAKARAAALFSMDLDASLISQYGSYLTQALRLDFGDSLLSPGVPVMKIIAARLPWTLFTVGSGLLLSFLFGILLGVFAAYNRQSWYEPLISGGASLLSAIPDFLIAIFLLLFLGVFSWGGRGTILPIHALRGNYGMNVSPGFNGPFIRDIFLHGLAPILTYMFSQLGIWVLLMKGSAVSCLNADYVTIARVRGLRPAKILLSYVGRNAMLPIVTEFTMRLGFIVGGALIIEQLFVYQGLGLELLNATSGRDYPLMQGIFLIMTIAIVFCNFLAEVLYALLDPRIRKGGSSGK